MPYKGSTYAEVCVWMEETQIEYKMPCTKKYPSLSYDRYMKYAGPTGKTTVGASLANGSKAEDLLFDFEKGHMKRIGGPIRDEPIDLKKADPDSLTLTDKVIGRWALFSLANQLGISRWDLTQTGQRQRAEDEAVAVMAAIQKDNRRVEDEDVLRVLRKWGWSQNDTRKFVIPDGKEFVYSDNLGCIRTPGNALIATQTTRDYPNVVRLLCRWLRDHQPKEFAQEFAFTTITLNKDYAAKLHRDSNNFGPSMIKAFGEYTGGEFVYWAGDDCGTRIASLRDLKLKDATALDIKKGVALFDGNRGHSANDFEGERYSVVFYSIKQYASIKDDDVRMCRERGFIYPNETSLDYFQSIQAHSRAMYWLDDPANFTPADHSQLKVERTFKRTKGCWYAEGQPKDPPRKLRRQLKEMGETPQQDKKKPEVTPDRAQLSARRKNSEEEADTQAAEKKTPEKMQAKGRISNFAKVAQREEAKAPEKSTTKATTNKPVRCDSRVPLIGERVQGEIGIAEVGDWRLLEGEIAIVQEVDEDGDFKLLNPHGQVSDFACAKFYVYVEPDTKTVFEELVNRSKALAYQMPTRANRLDVFCNGSTDLLKEAVEHAQSTRPVVHPRLLELVRKFLECKRQHGSSVEKDLYKGLDEHQMICRLLTKRPLMFMTESDMYMLRDGVTRGSGVQGPARFDDIGTDCEQQPLVLSNYLSYEEMELSALVGMSVPTHFINSGARSNSGKSAASGSFEAKGVYVGLVGCRFERANLMEWKHMIVTERQNTEEKGYGRASSNPLLQHWAKLYGIDHFHTAEEANADHDKGGDRFAKLNGGRALLDTKVYAARCEIMAELFLSEANTRAGEADTRAFCHVVGLGLGVWQVDEKQAQIQVDAYAAAMRRMDLEHVGELHFSWFPAHAITCGGVRSGGMLRTKSGRDIRIVFDKRDPAEPLPRPSTSEKPWLLVAQYAWDGNSYPGNEYWAGHLSASGDPAAACCSFIPELQNPDVNPDAFKPDRVHIVEGLKQESTVTEKPKAKRGRPPKTAAAPEARGTGNRVLKSFLKKPAA